MCFSWSAYAYHYNFILCEFSLLFSLTEDTLNLFFCLVLNVCGKNNAKNSLRSAFSSPLLENAAKIYYFACISLYVGHTTWKSLSHENCASESDTHFLSCTYFFLRWAIFKRKLTKVWYEAQYEAKLNSHDHLCYIAHTKNLTDICWAFSEIKYDDGGTEPSACYVSVQNVLKCNNTRSDQSSNILMVRSVNDGLSLSTCSWKPQLTKACSFCCVIINKEAGGDGLAFSGIARVNHRPKLPPRSFITDGRKMQISWWALPSFTTLFVEAGRVSPHVRLHCNTRECCHDHDAPKSLEVAKFYIWLGRVFAYKECDD